MLRTVIHVLVAMTVGLMMFAAASPTALAGDCTLSGGKVRPPGTIVYNSDFKQMQYCDGANWRMMMGGGVSGGGGGTPVGTVIDYAGSSPPAGWLLCYGQVVSRTTYATLFAVIGTTYGAGDGSTTFNLPDARGRVVAGKDDMGGTSADRLTGQSGGVDGDILGGTGGAETHQLTAAELAAHTHTLQHRFATTSDGSSGNRFGNSGNKDAGLTWADYPSDNNNGSLRIVAAGSDQPHNNVPPTVIFNKIIYAGN